MGLCATHVAIISVSRGTGRAASRKIPGECTRLALLARNLKRPDMTPVQYLENCRAHVFGHAVALNTAVIETFKAIDHTGGATTTVVIRNGNMAIGTRGAFERFTDETGNPEINDRVALSNDRTIRTVVHEDRRLGMDHQGRDGRDHHNFGDVALRYHDQAGGRIDAYGRRQSIRPISHAGEHASCESALVENHTWADAIDSNFKRSGIGRNNRDEALKMKFPVSSNGSGNILWMKRIDFVNEYSTSFFQPDVGTNNDMAAADVNEQVGKNVHSGSRVAAHRIVKG